MSLSQALEHLQRSYPELRDLLELIPREKLILQGKDENVLHSVIYTICGQMLSAKAAETIFERIVAACPNRDIENIFILKDDKLREAGFSKQKTRTVREIESYINTNGTLENWSTLEGERLVAEISSIWGLSHWSARILALSHFGLPDIYPVGDGTLEKVERKIQAAYYPAGHFDISKAKPFRSYLARAMWALYDLNMLD